jgi:simple sugar transport system substrate-binding protein
VKRLALLVALLVFAGCGKVTEVREPDVFVSGEAVTDARDAPNQQARGVRIPNARIVFITHGQASDPFWTIVKRGLGDAQRQSGTGVSYRAPDRFSIERMRRYIEEAIVDKPDGMVVSLPDFAALAPTIRRAVEAGIPVVTINSGSDKFQSLGVLAHIGQPEDAAGKAAGERLARTGTRRGLCVNHEQGNAGLVLRCRAFIRAMRRSGGDADVLAIDIQNRAATRAKLVEAIRSRRLDGVLTLSSQGAEAALDAVRSDRRARRVQLATFDLSPAVLKAISHGEMRFAVDQQAYLQGYLPVVLLAQRIRYGIFAGEGMVLPTGPSYVTRDTAGQVVRLSERGIR